jgi:putative ABC transport system permease protein
MEHAVSLFGSFDENIKLIEKEFSVSILTRGSEIRIHGEEENTDKAKRVLIKLLYLLNKGETLSEQNIRYVISLVNDGNEDKLSSISSDCICISAKGKPIKPKTLGQKNYIDKINQMSDEEVERTSKEQARPQLVESVKAQKEQTLNSMNLTPEMKASELDKYIKEATNEQVDDLYKNYIPSEVSSLKYEDVLNILGVVDINSPKSIFLYAIDFEGKDKIQSMVNEYNSGVIEDDQIKYTDYVALIMSGVSDIINAISYVLIGFVSISLVVSSIMIGIITYISVIERTKEIGVLRAVGARKKDISRVFNAETFAIGLASGLFGVLVTILLCIPINVVLFNIMGVRNVAFLNPSHAIVVVIIGFMLTIISGLIPSRMASKQDPVIALRSE